MVYPDADQAFKLSLESKVTVMQTNGILETCLYVDNLDVAEEFYSRIFGLKLHSKMEGRHVFFHCGEQMFLLFDPKNTGEHPAPHGAIGAGHVAFLMEPEDTFEWRKHLLKNDVEVIYESALPNGSPRNLFFRDPAGNLLEIIARGTMWGNNETE